MKHVDIWTDGASKGNPGIGGYGVVIKYTDKNGDVHRKEIKEAFDETTNNRMEVLSAIVALKNLKESCDVTLYSDSKYLVNAFNEHWVDDWIESNFREGRTNEVKNIDLWKELIELVKYHKVKLIWVKGHADNVENERCDELANIAIDEFSRKRNIK